MLTSTRTPKARLTPLAALLLLGACAEPPPADFSLVVLPDTQCYSFLYPEILDAQGQYVRTRVQAGEVRGVLHLGDMTENNVPEEWGSARSAFAGAFGEVPFGVSPGNHDLGLNGSARSCDTLLADFFLPEEIEATPGFIASFDGPANTAWSVDGDVHRYVFVALEFAPRRAVVEWARGVLEGEPDAIAIVSTHAYLDADGRRYDHLNLPDQEFCPHEYGVTQEDGSDGEELFQALIRPSRNVRLVLSGHVPNGFAYATDVNASGATVHQLMADYQTGTSCPTEGGDGRGYLLDLHVNERPGAADIRVSSYSPWEDRDRGDHVLAFALDAP